ncbi:hypothetical protein O0I10_004907 [Lichtheimia ornata]|uniref:Uncharacterized protein n=1 Tax=Lichtheimia ornata TaxID=688661 RepID=A0AAD7Y202_9FUNG|nr:uncharacterized protein O0I10_004907 [Lichtheimia ornata]KAJ8659542.1 hypothetical protein O0I10_004907 [Lichtheimia ornata]
MSSKASETAVDEKSIEVTTVSNNETAKEDVEWKDPPDGGWKAWPLLERMCILARNITEQHPSNHHHPHSTTSS